MTNIINVSVSLDSLSGVDEAWVSEIILEEIERELRKGMRKLAIEEIQKHHSEMRKIAKAAVSKAVSDMQNKD